MTKDPKIGVFWKLMFGIVTSLSFVLPVLSDWSKMAKTTCPDGFGLNYTLPMSHKCEMKRLHDGSMVQSIPKLIHFSSVIGGCHRRKSKEGIPGGPRICRIPDCGKKLCKNGWCEETIVGYNCHCSSGFQGRHCDEQSAESSTTDKTTKPKTSPTTMTERSDATTSQKSTTSKSAESSTTDKTTKPKTSPTTMTERSDATTSQKSTTSTYSSPPKEYEFDGSFYNFSTCRMNHTSAVSACSQYGSHLVFIESQEEQDFIVQYLDAFHFYWIGLTGLSFSEARWLDGSSLTYNNFNNISFNQNVNCFRIKSKHPYSWLDKNCSKLSGYMCEKEVGT